MGLLFGGILVLAANYLIFSRSIKGMRRRAFIVLQMAFSTLLTFLCRDNLDVFLSVSVSLVALSFFQSIPVLWVGWGCFTASILLMAGDQELGSAILFYLGWILSETLLLTQFLTLFAKRVRELDQLRATIRNQAENGNTLESVKSNFLRNICHELRTPASSILGFSELLQESNLDSTQRGHVSVIKRCSEVLLGLTNDLLDLSKIDSRMLKVERHHYDLHKLHQEIKDMFELKCAQKGIELEVVVDESIPRMAIGDSHRTRQVLMNLVGNAVKFTEKGKIKIEVKKDPQMPLYHWRVSDTGRGIPEANIPHLFKSYYQGDPSVARLYGGTGLGLMISKKLVELMDGEISVASQFGEGSIFTFSIPLRED